jgi:SH3-like domain-containing protein
LRRIAVALAIALACLTFQNPGMARAQSAAIDLAARKKGASTGLPVPRFVSLKADEVNVRKGPGWDHAIAWVFRRAGLPVEVIAEFDVWRQVRDSDGATGWVVGSLLSGRRTALIAPWKEKTQATEMYASATQSSAITAKLSPGVLGDLRSCDGQWCRMATGNFSGYLAQDLIWGVYPGERVE